MYANYYFHAEFFFSFFLDHEVDFYFKNPNPEIKNQMLMIACSKTQIFVKTVWITLCLHQVLIHHKIGQTTDENVKKVWPWS